MKEYVTLGVFRQVALLPLAAGLISIGLGVTGAVIGYLLSSILVVCLGFWFLWKALPEGISNVSSDWQVLKLLRFSLPLWIAGFSFLVMSRTDLMMLGYFVPSADVGAYRAAVSLGRLTLFGLTAVNTAFAPMISKLYSQEDMSELGRMYKISARWIALLSLTLGLPMVLFPGKALGLYGGGFRAAILPLVALVGFQIVNAGVGSVGFLLQMSGNQDYVLANNLFTAVLNIGLNLWLIPRLGITGAAIATGSSLALNNLIGLVEVRWILKLNPFSLDYAKLLYPVLISISTFYLLSLSAWAWFYKLIVVMVAYSLGFLLFSLNDTDRMLFRAVRDRMGV